MSKVLIAGALSVPVLIGAASFGPAQTAQPGQMTEARVWVQNRGQSEAVAVNLRDVNLERPLKVLVANDESGLVVPTRTSRQLWEYQTVAIPPTADVAAVLNERGRAGWEAIGTMRESDEGATVLLKRPR